MKVKLIKITDLNGANYEEILLYITKIVPCNSSLICDVPNSCLSVALVEAYNIFWRTGAVSGDQLINSHSYPEAFFVSNLKATIKL